jgi:hypothetical protein
VKLKKMSHKELVKEWKNQFGNDPLPMMEPAEWLSKDELIQGIQFAHQHDKAKQKAAKASKYDGPKNRPPAYRRGWVDYLYGRWSNPYPPLSSPEYEQWEKGKKASYQKDNRINRKESKHGQG